MSRRSHLRTLFVEFIPDELQEGVLYVSEEYSTSAHLCMCGCGKEVVNPLNAQQWTLEMSGDRATLCPSIGNWSFACQSHYWIRDNRIDWAPAISEEAIARTRRERAESIRASQRKSLFGRLRRALRNIWRSIFRWR